MAAEKSPVGWALTPLKKYAQFSGRAPRAEFWWFFLFTLIIYMVAWFLLAGTMMGAAAGGEPSTAMLPAMGGGMIIMTLCWLALIVPTIAVQVRRLHDTNRSAWWIGAFYILYAVYFVMLFGSMASMMASAAAGETAAPTGAGSMLATGALGLVMFIYGIVLLVFFCLPGTPGPNRFGLDPYGAHENLEGVFS